MGPLLKILRFFIENKGQASINALAGKLGMNYRIAYYGVKELEKEGLIAVKRLGNSNQCSLSYGFNDKVLLVENMRKEELLKNTDISIINDQLEDVENPLFICLVFGSYASSKQKKNSDIDICVIAEEKTSEEVKRAIRGHPVKTHILAFTPREFKAMMKTTEENVGKEIKRMNVILNGTEEYYRMNR
ncbi:MAG: nucleotidyltransferase domain-containing protein [archaeon]